MTAARARRDTLPAVLGELIISGLGVIDDARIDPAPGLTVVTGETGAGKTMVVTALGLVSGGRGDSGRVRRGAKRAVIEARFLPGGVGGTVGPHLSETAESVGGDVDDDGSLLAVRSISADGRSRAHIGGRSVPVASLAALAEPLVTIHGQSDAMRLLTPANQRVVLDRYADVEQHLEHYRQQRQQWLAARQELERRTTRVRELAQREQVLRIGLDEIERAAPKPGEDATLVAEVRRLGDVDALRDAAMEALTALSGPDEASTVADAPSATGLVRRAIDALGAASDPALTQRLDDLRGAGAVLGDVGADLATYLDGLDADPARLESLLQRQAALRSLVRKYGDDVDAVLRWAADARAELVDVDGSDEALAELRTRVDALAAEMTAAAADLTARRREAARRLQAAATAELAHLAMSTAALRVAVTDRGDLGADGGDQVEILLTPHRGAPELAVARGASGGELSRIMLALEVVLLGADPVATLVFDEVDAGVGGRAATEIGRRLAMLAERHQVIVVTHVAQVAAFAAKQYVVDADTDGTVGASAVRAVDGDARVAELARMLGGTDTDTAQAHASDLLATAQQRSVTA